MVKCEVCSALDHKYKCPKCLIRYCSLNCYKRHQVSVCVEKGSVSNNGEVKTGADKVKSDSNQLLTSEDRVPLHRLEMLRQDKELLITLQNPHVRQIMLNVNSSRNPAVDLKNAMREPIFVEFADQCLRIVDSNSSDKS